MVNILPELVIKTSQESSKKLLCGQNFFFNKNVNMLNGIDLVGWLVKSCAIIEPFLSSI